MALDDLGDERLRALDLGEVGRMRRRGVAEPRDRGFELAVRQVDAGDARSGRDERLGAREADPALRPVTSATCPSSRHDSGPLTRAR